MSAHATRSLARFPSLLVALYCGLMIGLCLTIGLSIVHIYDSYATYHVSTARLARFQDGAHINNDAAPSGSPFLEGPSATVANATLLQRVTSAIAAAGGNVVSSEIEQAGAQSKEGYLKVVSTLEIRQDALQRLLHDLEAGMPFLFIEQLLVQSTTNAPENDRLRVRLAVSGLWRGGR